MFYLSSSWHVTSDVSFFSSLNWSCSFKSCFWPLLKKSFNHLRKQTTYNKKLKYLVNSISSPKYDIWKNVRLFQRIFAEIFRSFPYHCDARIKFQIMIRVLLFRNLAIVRQKWASQYPAVQTKQGSVSSANNMRVEKKIFFSVV